MFRTTQLKLLTAVVATAVAFSVAQGSARAGEFSAPWLQCSSVTVPAGLSCTASATQDALKFGHATVDDSGGVTFTMESGAPNTTFAVSYVSVDGSQSVSIANLVTNAKGNGALREDHFWAGVGKVGAGNFVLTQSVPPVTGTQFVTGATISPTGLPNPPREDYRATLVRCGSIDIFETASPPLSTCGSDPLSSGYADIDFVSGNLAINISGAAKMATYSAQLIAQNGTTLTLGTINTDKHGSGFLTKSSFFAEGKNISGTVELLNTGIAAPNLEFLSGFKVTQRFIAPTTTEDNFVACGEVTDPSGLDCGSDTLDSGTYSVSANGTVTVKLSGAPPSTNYELWFRPLGSNGSALGPDVDTGLEVPTNANGNTVSPAPSIKFFSSDTVWSGTFVLKEKGETTDEFVVGFTVY
ncbi:MAG: hypothetical protein WA005_04975 [Candidatus Binataceae bacterium]